MTDAIKKFFGVHVDSEDARMRAAIKRSGARVVGRGTVVIDSNKVRNSKNFRDNAKLAQNLVKKAS